MLHWQFLTASKARCFKTSYWETHSEQLKSIMKLALSRAYRNGAKDCRQSLKFT
jgi:hypothetical protein